MQEERGALISLIFNLVESLERLGDDHTVGYLFKNIPKALAAIRRYDPAWADRLLAKEAEAKAKIYAGHDIWHGPQPEKGRRKGSIVVGGAEFWTAPDGTVMRDGRSTGMRINTEYNCWSIVDPKDPFFRTRRHFVSIGGKAMALFEAARIVQDRQKKQE